MTPEAARRVLYAEPQGNGVTGFVAATGKSYLCGDAANDPLYIEGAAGARSSLTVPLLHEDQVIGTFNVESPTLHGFGEQDLQFAEIFCREIASALHTLELLSAEKHSTATRSVEAISREVALPVDDILTAATAVLDRYIGHDPEMAAKLRQILAGARAIKQSIQKVGEDLVPASRHPDSSGRRHPAPTQGEARAGRRQRRARPPVGPRAAWPLGLRRRDRPRCPGSHRHGPAGHLRLTSWPTSACRTAAATRSTASCVRPSRTRASSS